MGTEKEVKVGVLGAGGMLGHVVCLTLLERGVEVVPLARRTTGVPAIDARLKQLDLSDFAALSSLLRSENPETVINCAAVLNDPKGSDPRSAFINSNLPQKLADLFNADLPGCRLVHISSDGVFSGTRGGYAENDIPDAEDPYGKAKRESEVHAGPHCTIRTSIIGPELTPRPALFEWMLRASGTISGFSEVYWNGVTTLELANFLAYLVKTPAEGLVHFHSGRISKFELLTKIKEVFAVPVEITPVAEPKLDRSLRSIRSDISYSCPSLGEMLDQLKVWINRRK